MGLSCGKRSKKITLTVLVLLLTVSIVLAVPPTTVKAGIEWDKSYGGEGDDEGWFVSNTTDGGYIIVGYSESFGDGDYDVWLIKTDENGNEEWSEYYGGTDDDEGYCVLQTSDGGYIIVGYTRSYGPGGSNVWLIKTDANGDEEWNQTYGGSGWDEGLRVLQTTDGGYIIVGYTSSYGAGDYDVWLIKTDQNGNHEWDQTYGGTEDDEGYCVEQTSDGGYIIAGYTESYGAGEEDVLFIKFDEDGNLLWNKTYGGTDDDEGYCVEQTSDGEYIITGYTGNFDDGWDVLLIKTDENGNKEWDKTYNEGFVDYGYCVLEASGGGYVIVGITGSFDIATGLDADVLLIKTDEDGNKDLDETYDKSYLDGGHWALETSDENYIIVGVTTSLEEGADVWLLEVSPKEGFPMTMVLLAVAAIGIVAVLAVLFMKRKQEA